MTYSDLSLTREGRVELLKVLEADLSILGRAIERDRRECMIHDIPKIIRLLTTIQIGVLSGL